MPQDARIVAQSCPRCAMTIDFTAPSFPGESLSCPRCRTYLEVEWTADPAPLWRRWSTWVFLIGLAAIIAGGWLLLG